MTMWNQLNAGIKWWLIFAFPLLAWLLAATGCSTMYPKLLDDPETIKAFAAMVRESNKTWTANGSVNNPEVEFYYKISFGGRVIGLETELGATGASGPQVVANQPVVLAPETDPERMP